MAWYNASWKYRKKITIPAANVGANLTDFPVYVDLSHLPVDFFSNVKSAGEDIRVTKSDGTTEVPREVVFVNTGSKTGELHFKVSGTLSSTVDNVFYIYYGNAAATEPAASATYGSQNVWDSNYALVMHLNEDGNNTTNGYKDSTANGYHGTGSSLTTSSDVAAVLGNGQTFDGSADHIKAGPGTGMDLGKDDNITLSCWFKCGTQSTSYVDVAGKDYASGPNGGYIIRFHNSTTKVSGFTGANPNLRNIQYATDVNDDTWRHAVVTHSPATSEFFINAGSVGTSSATETEFLNTNEFMVAARQGSSSQSNFFNGEVDEVRVSNIVRSDTWISVEYSNQNAPESFYTIGSTESDTGANWYNASWDKRIKVDIDPTKVPSGLTDFPLYVDLSLLPAGFFSTVKTDGSDIRITTADGVTELPLEIVSISTGSSTGELHTKYPYLNGTGTDAIYIYYGNSGASAYAASATYGSQNVWNSNYVAVWHNQEDPSGSAPQIKDSTANGFDMTSAGSMTSGDSVAGKLAGNALDFDGVDDYTTVGDAAALDLLGQSTVQCWLKSSDLSHGEGILSKASHTAGTVGWLIGSSTNVVSTGLTFLQEDAASNADVIIEPNTNVADGAWRMIHAVRESAAARLYYNGTLVGSDTSPDDAPGAGTHPVNQGSRGDSGVKSNVVLDEVRLIATDLSADWITTEYNNQNAANTFYSVGSEETGDVPPTLSSTVPVDNATDVGIAADLTATFSENVVKGTGNITIKRTTGDTTFETIDVTSGQVSITNNVVTINPSSNLENSTEYYILIDATAFDDTTGNSYAGISSTTEWSFTTAAPDLTDPILASSTPVDGAMGVTASADIILNFTEDVVKGTGNITIKNYDTDATIEAIDVTSGQVVISGSQVTINPTSDLPNATHVYILIDATCFDDTSGNSYAGIASKDTLDFTIADTANPVVTTLTPYNGETGVDPATDLTIIFDENVVKGGGNITVKVYDTDATVEAIAVGAAAVVVTNNQVVVSLTNPLGPLTKYYVLIDATCFDDTSGNSYAGISSKDDFAFTTLPVGVDSLSPADGATGVAANSNLVVDFNQNVSAGTGNVTIANAKRLQIGNGFVGDIAELIMFQGRLSVQDRQKIEGYLSWEYNGNGDLLPSGHPYKFTRPLV